MHCCVKSNFMVLSQELWYTRTTPSYCIHYWPSSLAQQSSHHYVHPLTSEQQLIKLVGPKLEEIYSSKRMSSTWSLHAAVFTLRQWQTSFFNSVKDIVKLFSSRLTWTAVRYVTQYPWYNMSQVWPHDYPWSDTGNTLFPFQYELGMIWLKHKKYPHDYMWAARLPL